MYRSALAIPSGQVTYGPFPLRWWQLGVAPVIWFMAFAFSGFAEVRLQMDCSRESCAVRAASWRRPVREIRDARITSVSVDRSQNKGRWSGRVQVKLSDGRSLSLEREDLPEALRQEQEIQALIEGRSPRFRYDSGDHWWFAPLSWGMYLAGVGLFVDALRRRRAFALQVASGAVVVREPARWWGTLPVRSVPLADAARVAVRWHLLRKAGGKTPARWGATLDVDLQDGRSVPLTEVPRDGLIAHYDAAFGLEQVLGVAPAPPRERCPEEALVPYRYQNAGMVFGMAWAGLCSGSLVGMALYAVASLLLDPASLDRNVDDRAMIAAAVGAVALAIVLVRIPLGKRRELERYERYLQGSVGRVEAGS